jgi:flagellar protein FliO/FliZ
MDMKPQDVILFLLGFGSILFLTYVTTKYIAGKSNRAMKGKFVNIIETVSLGMDKRIHLVKAGEQYLLISSTSKSIELLSTVTLEGEETKSGEEPVIQNLFDFKSLFEKYMNSYKSKKINKSEQNSSDISINRVEGENFRTNLERLKVITQKTAGKDGDDTTDEK